jgi:hypothetical protein
VVWKGPGGNYRRTEGLSQIDDSMIVNDVDAHACGRTTPYIPLPCLIVHS